MRIVFFGDSITDAGRNREDEMSLGRYGYGFVHDVSSTLMYQEPNKYQIYNRGIGGNRSIDLYARIKNDLWNLQPDLISLYVGVNDLWHEIKYKNGLEVERFEKIYKMILDDTLKVLPNVKFILVSPYVMNGTRTSDEIEKFREVDKYEKVIEKIAKEYDLPLVKLQPVLNEYAKKYGDEYITFDGIHPNITGARIIAEEWLKVFNKNK